MKRTMWIALSLLGLALLNIIAGCGGGSAATTSLPISVAVAPGSATVQAGGTLPINATVNNDPANKGVTWAISPASGAGSLSNSTNTSVVYDAPASPPASDVNVTITATSVADTSKSGSATVTVGAITVSVSATVGTVQAGGTVSINANVNNDPSNQGVTWTLSPSSGAGTLTNVASTSVTYDAPASPGSDLKVTITATSVDDKSKSGSATITVAATAVSITPSNATVESESTQPFTAIVQNDPAHKGVTWTISPASGAGTLSNVTSTSVTYNAPGPPASLPAGGLDATITATSVADPLGLSSANVTVPPIAVAIKPSSATVQAGSSQPFTVTVQNDPANQGVTWTLSPASGAGALSNVTSTSVTYNAPANPPASDLGVAITATPVSDPRQSVQVGITVPAIKVSVLPVSALIPINATQQFAATVQFDPTNKGVTWTLTQGTASCSPGCGTVPPSNTATTTYTAPPAVPANATVTLTATSAADKTKAASATITITIGTVKIVPASLDFGAIKFSRSSTMMATLTNTGGTTLSITSIKITGTNPDKFPETDNCDGSVGTGNSCAITVTFTPKVVGLFSAILSISDSSAGSPQQVRLSGSGVFRRFVPGAAMQSALGKIRTVAVPNPTGPSHVGTRVLDLIDSTRNDPYLANGTKRELLVRFWYPASVSRGCKPAEYTNRKVWDHFSQLLGIPLPEVRTNSCLDAPITEGAHPVIVFTHGYTGTFTDYTFLFEDLASRGYVVASVDHTYEATAVEFPDGRLVKSALGSHLGNTLRSDEQALSSAVTVRLSDLKFVVNELERLNANAESPFGGKLDVSSVALAGHSLGGLTAILGIEEEPRFRAGIVLDGVMPDSLATAIDTPMLLLATGGQLWSAEECRLWGDLHGPRLAVNFKDDEHLTPSDAVWLAKGAVKTGTMGTEKTVAAIRNYVAAFLDANLRGRPSKPLLTGSANYPDAAVTTQKQWLCGEP